MAYPEFVIDNYETGWPNQVYPTLNKKIGQYSTNAKAEYIGMTSGNEDESAMKSRYDSVKKDLEINKMIILYRTDSREHAIEVEEELIEHSKKNHKDINQNQKSGGAGRKPDEKNSPKFYYVYAAYNY